jgi:hypothetical protein
MTATFSPELNPTVKLGAKPQELAAGYASGMDIFAIRRANFLDLAAGLMKKDGALKKDAAAKLDMGASYFSQLLNGKKIGEDVARKVEISLGLPFGYMDKVHEPKHQVREEPAIYASHDLRVDPEIISGSLKLIRLTFANLGLEFDNEEDGVPLAFAYEYLLSRQERTVTPENLVDFSKKLAEKLRGKENGTPSGRSIGSAGGGNRQQG